MNRSAGIVSAHLTEDSRESLLRRALGPGATVRHPRDDLSIGWEGSNRRIALSVDCEDLIFVHGSGYGTTQRVAAVVRADDAESLARGLRGGSANDSNEIGGAFWFLNAASSGAMQLSGDSTGGRAPYYAHEPDRFVFASHPLICAKLQSVAALDRSMEDFFLVHGFLPQGHTSYRNVRQLSSKLTMCRDGGEWREVPRSIGCEVRPAEKEHSSLESVYDGLYEKLLEGTRQQLTDAEEVGVLLGGFDSALIASILSRLGKRVRTYSFRYADQGFNQPHVDDLAQFLGCDHSWVDITPTVIADGLRNYGVTICQPTNWANYIIQTVHVCHAMRADGIRHAYSGDGCDALFLGYPGTYRRTYIFSRLPKLPRWFTGALLVVLGSKRLDRLIGHPYRVALNLLRATARDMPQRAFLTFRVMDEITADAIRLGRAPEQLKSVELIAAELGREFNNLSLQRLGYASKALVSPNRAKLLACFDVADVCVHTPYLHPELRRYVEKLPDTLLREAGQTSRSDPGKICLMRMAERHQLLPRAVIHQPKLAAIDSPIDGWWGGALRPTLDSILKKLPFEYDQRQVDSLISVTAAERLYKRYVGSTQVISDAISLLVTYAAACGALGDATNEPIED